MLQSTEGLPGPVTGEQVGEAGHQQAEIGARAGRPGVLQRAAPPLPRMSILSSAPVMASKPIAKTMASTAYSRALVRTPVRGDRLDRLVREVDQGDVVAVEGLVVAGVDADPLGAERVGPRARASRRSPGP